ncbi:MAG TPA: SpvB/TcaC N-terminal domain-containing protein, partial [Gammaproteobacteria bacterium]
MPARAASPDTHPGALWLVENRGAIVIKTLTGSVGPEISDLSEMDVVGTDYSTGNAWFYGNSQLVSVSPASEIIAAFPLPALANGNADALLFDDQGSQVWIATGKTLARVSSEGVVLGKQTLDSNIAALAFDRVREQVWVAMPGKLAVFDAESNPLFEIDYQQPGRIWNIHYDRGLDRVWVTSHAGLQWYAPDGTLGGAFASPVSPFADHVSADGEGCVWIAGTHDIAALTADGSLLFQFRVFSPATGFQAGGRSRGLFADPSSDSAWTINGRWAVQVSADGDVVQAVEMVVDGAPRNIHTGALHYDVTPPVIEIIKPASETFTSDNTPGILVAYDDFGSAVDTETFEFTLDGKPLSVSCEANAQDAVCVPVEPIQDGEVTIAVTVEDLAFNRSAAGSTRFTVDIAPPELVEIVPANDLLTNKSRQTLVGRFNEPVTLKINAADVLLTFSEAFEHHIELVEGENAIRFVATDRAGNVGEASITYMLDTVPPVITVTSPEDNLHTRDESVTVAGYVNEPALVSIDDEIAGLEGLEFSGQPQLIEGLNPISVEAVDLATNASHETVHVTLDTTPPLPPGAITVVETEDGIEIIGGPGAVDPYAQVQILPSNALLFDEDIRGLDALRAFIRIIQSGYADANGAFSIMIDNADIPPGGLRIRVIDRAGNNSDSMPLPEPEPDRRNHPVGRLPGELSVDSTGAANYRIPLELPKGAAGMQPDLALLYSSRAGNGHLGVGWSLSGLSAVTRCPKTIAQDGISLGIQFDDTDKFCLDGRRIIKKGSSWSNAIEYRTEIESFQKVTSEAWSISTIPDHFEVRDKSGLIRQYGTTQDSRVNVQGSVVPMLWAISRIRDRFGNYIAYTYEENSDANGSGEFYPKEIAWYNNQDQLIGRVKLEYGARPDKAAGFIPGGGKTALTKRLEEIKVYAGAELARYYKLQYEQAPASGLSALISAQLCASENQCFPETRFGWKHPGAYPAHLSGINIDDEFMAADIDGDGLPDWVYWDDGQFIIKFGDHSKGYRATNISVLQDGGFCDFAFDPGDFDQYAKCVDKYKLAIQFSLVGDYDGDGFDDVLVPQAANEHYWLLKSTGENLQLVDSEAIHNDIDKYRHLEDSSNVALDINGDGKAEALIKKFQTLFIERYEDGVFESSTDTGLAVHFSHRLVPLEANGDGIPDLYIPGDSIGGVLLGTGENFEIPWNRGPRTDKPVMIDANGDGLTDILRKQDEQWALHVNTGDGWQATAWRGGNWQDHEMRALDWNRDGKQDLMVAEAKGNWDGPYGTVWTVHLSNGDGFGAKQNSGFNDGAHGGRHYSARFMDLTGDGIEDLFYDDGENRWSMLRPSGIGQSILTGVVDGYSMETAVGYLPLSLLGDDYLGDSDAGLEPEDRDKWNIRDFQGPVPVVRFFAQDTGRVLHNGNHVKVVTSYRYKGGKIDIHGRGFLGFAEVHASNANTGIDTVNHHKQSFPFTGMVHKAEQWRPEATSPEDIDNDALRDRFFPGCPSVDPFSISAIDCDLEPFKVASGIGFAETTADGELISRTTNALETREIGNSHFVWAASTDSRDYDLGSGSLVRRIRTAYEYDDHGNATLVDVRTDDGSGGDLHRVRTVNTYDDNTTIWLLGRLASATVTHSAPGTASITRRAEFSYAAGNGQLTREVLEPGNPQLELVTEYAHDGFGNIQTRTVSSGAIGEYAIQSRTTVTNYDSRGVYPESTRNHLGHTESYTWNAKFNAKTASTGPNGLVTSWSYNSFGQLTGEVTPRSALQSTTSRNWCGGGTACHHENAETQVRTTSSAGGERIVELDRIGREVFAYERGLDSEYIAIETWYDMLGRPYLVSNPYRFDDPVVCYVFREYDNLNRVIKEHRPASANECDRRSDLDVALLYDHTTPPPRYTAVTTYNYNGLKTTVTHPIADGVVVGQPRVVERTENVAGRLLKVVEWLDSGTAQTTYAYTATGETSSVTPPSDHAITLNYDKRGRKTSMQDPDMGHWQYRHNALGELVWQQDSKDQVVTLEYDVLGRMIRRTESEGITSWTYDTAPGKGIGKLASVEQHDGYREAYAYTAFGEVDTQLKIIDGFAYFTRTTYDAFGRVSNVLYPAARDIPAAAADVNTPDTAGALQLTHHYGGSGKLKRVQRADGDHNTIYWQAEKINAQGQLERATLGNGLANSARFDAATGMVLELGVGSAGNTNYTRQFQSYAWDSAGNLLSRTDQLTGVHETFQYDRLYRLTKAVLHAGYLDISQSFEYDAAGNLKRKGNLRNYQYGEGATGQTRPHAVIGIDRFSGSEKTETLAYLYDANGNVEDANGRIITWSSFNKPVRIEKGSAWSSFAYGPGRKRYQHIKHYGNGDAETTHYAGLVERIEKTRGISTSVEYRQHIIAGGNVVAIVTDYTTSGVENTRYLHRDHLGSVTLITDNAGKIVEQYQFDAWGQAIKPGTLTPDPWRITPLLDVTTTRGFTGHEMLDHLGLVHM